MRITKPFKLGILHKPYLYQKQHHLVVCGLVFFKLGGKPELVEERFAWPAITKSLPLNQVLDMVMPKKTAEVLLAGSAYAPSGKPCAQVDVRLQLGSVDKTLRVIGDREWRYGLVPLHQISDPKTFTQIKLGWEKSYGGEKYKSNPLGKGYTGNRLAAIKGVNKGAMPNIEYPEEPVKGHVKKYQPAGFGVVDLNWPQRQKLAGTYGKDWQQNHAPGLATDIDWRIFNAAPNDQWLPGFFQGGESYCLTNLTKEKSQVSGQLPKLRVRPFIERNNGAFEEIETVFDTVWLFPDENLGVAIYRGKTDIEHRQAKDIANLMLAYESQEDKPRSKAYYQEAMKLRVDKKTAAQHVFNEGQLSPVLSEQEAEKRAAIVEKAKKKDLAKRQAVLDEREKEFWQKSGQEKPVDYKAPKAQEAPLGVIPQELLDSGDFDLTEFLEKADKVAADAKKQAEEKKKKLDEERKKLAKEMQALGVEQNQEQHAPWNEVYQRAAEIPRDLYLELAPPVVSPLQQLIRDAKAAGGDVSEKQEEQAKAFASQQAELKRKGRQFNPTAAYPEKPLSEDQAKKLGECIQEWKQEHKPLAGRDWAGANLKGADFSGLDLRQVMLENADLSHCRFDGANLEGAVFTGANLTGASFKNAKVVNANFCGANAQGADFSHADLSETRWTKSLANKSIFDGATLNRAMFSETQMRDSTGVGASMQHATLHKVNWQQANWSESKSSQCTWAASDLSQSIWKNADWHQVAMAECQLTGADFSHGKGDALCLVKVDACHSKFKGFTGKQCGWRGAQLVAADLSEINLIESDLGEANLSQANLEKGVVARGLLMGANATQAKLNHLNAFQCKAGEMVLQDAVLDYANFTQADLSESQGEPASDRGMVQPNGERKAA